MPTAKGESFPAVTERERRLHGFAVLVALGDDVAANAAWQAARAAYPVAQHHREQPADGWQRRRVVEELREGTKQHIDRWLGVAPQLPMEHRARLRGLGASDAAMYGLRALSPFDRGVVIAVAAERLDDAALRTLVGRGQAATRRTVTRAMRRYLRAVQATLGSQPWTRRQPSGELAERVAQAAAANAGGPS